MANRYWVGGTGTWDTAANWASTSGGSGGAGIPTASDSVFFDGNSGTGTCTIDGGNVSTHQKTVTSFTTTGYNGYLAFSGATYPAQVVCNGDFTLNSALNGRITGNSGSYFKVSTSSTKNVSVNLAGVTLPVPMLLYAVGSPYTLSLTNTVSATSVAMLANSGGVINTGGYNITANSAQFDISVGAGSTINLGSSTITQASSSSYVSGTIDGTLNAGTSTLIIYGYQASSSSLFGPLYNVEIPQGTTSSGVGFLSCANLAISGNYVTYLYDYVTISGTLTITGSSPATPATIRSTSGSTARTITAANTNLTNVAWYYITAAGGASPFRGTGFTDLGGNTNILFGPENGLFFGSNF